jgi:hypothetical protein
VGCAAYAVDVGRCGGGHWPFMHPRLFDAEVTAEPAVRASIFAVIIIQ